MLKIKSSSLDQIIFLDYYIMQTFRDLTIVLIIKFSAGIECRETSEECE